MLDLHDFLEPISFYGSDIDFGYNDGQLATHVNAYKHEMPDVANADIVIMGIGESRGSGIFNSRTDSPDAIRKYLYQLHYWHYDVQIADIGNIKTGASITDSYAAFKTVLSELLQLNKTVIILGGSHDLTLAQYFAYRDAQQLVEATCIDAMIDLRGESSIRSENFLLDMLTSEPNLVKHYNHIGFQSYFVHPVMLERMDKLRFDCFRLGHVKDNIDEMEPVLRNTNLLSFDISAIKHSDAPANEISPNGLTGEEACTLTRYAGMSDMLSSFGIYGYDVQSDVNELTAKQIAQMIWYFIDGKYKSKQEVSIEEREYFNEYNTAFAEVDTVFLQSKRSNRWWMQLPNKKFIACSYNDYVNASRNMIPERWLRAQERT
ncbi:formimidoylglutamase [Ferruginibacter albus]|uniref:formimidoylglutamase n=1 Tax=Ferruginibacter albus TaxID=2875540 RepID=UPI001CC6C5AD|nr:formimidoylglutamase [Ferruginibacter albus]UAY51893.1 formimidoylglutamase [Ferruginibacter albus]